MKEDLARQTINEIDPEGIIPPDVVEELIKAIGEVENAPPGIDMSNVEMALREQMKYEVDWRKKAALAAKIISLGLE